MISISSRRENGRALERPEGKKKKFNLCSAVAAICLSPGPRARRAVGCAPLSVFLPYDTLPQYHFSVTVKKMSSGAASTTATTATDVPKSLENVRQNPKDCLACRVIGTAALGGVGIYALNQSRAHAPGSIAGKRVMAGLGVCTYDMESWL